MKSKPVYKNKKCTVCGKSYKPTSPKQKFCVMCKYKANKESQKLRDKKRNRNKHKTPYEIKCPNCNEIFTTYYPQKKYCGKDECEVYRLKIKNKIIHERRDKQQLSDKGKRYYKNNREKCLIKKANEYRKLKPKAKPYVPGKINKHIFEFVKNYVEKYNYTLLSEEYTNNRDLITLRCEFGHKWLTSFHNFKDSENRCATCYQQNNYISKPEQLIRDFLLEELPEVNVIYNDRSVIGPKELDFYFPDNNLAIEVCGLYWHGEVSSGKDRKYHYDKMQQCFDKGIRLITIFEDELINQKDIVCSRIRQALGKPSRRIYARKCKVKELISKEANSFYTSNHVQGKSTALVRYGLYYEDELVCVGSLGKIVRKHTSNVSTIELKRFCTLPNVSVIGGVGKIFKVMKKYAVDNGFTDIKSYCDMRYANIFNPVYEVLDFELEGYTKYTPHYFKAGKRYRNYSLRKTVEERLTGKTEWELRQAQGYDRIWDCGHRTYVYKL